VDDRYLDAGARERVTYVCGAGDHDERPDVGTECVRHGVSDDGAPVEVGEQFVCRTVES
jgi:hypothetical protein